MHTAIHPSASRYVVPVRNRGREGGAGREIRCSTHDRQIRRGFPRADGWPPACVIQRKSPNRHPEGKHRQQHHGHQPMQEYAILQGKLRGGLLLFTLRFSVAKRRWVPVAHLPAALMISRDGERALNNGSSRRPSRPAGSMDRIQVRATLYSSLSTCQGFNVPHLHCERSCTGYGILMSHRRHRPWGGQHSIAKATWECPINAS